MFMKKRDSLVYLTYNTTLDKAIDVYSHYEKILLVGDFNGEISEFCLDYLLYQHELKDLV